MRGDKARAEALRLDKWLWHARFFRTRGLARKACEAGRIRVNGKRVAKAHHAVGLGDVLTFVQGGAVRVVRISGLSNRRGPATEARRLYEETDGAQDDSSPVAPLESAVASVIRSDRDRPRQGIAERERPHGRGGAGG